MERAQKPRTPATQMKAATTKTKRTSERIPALRLPLLDFQPTNERTISSNEVIRRPVFPYPF